jgi:hypothetical protein
MPALVASVFKQLARINECYRDVSPRVVNAMRANPHDRRWALGFFNGTIQ